MSSTAKPALSAEMSDVVSRTTMNTGPSNAYVTARESTPFCGVATKNDTVPDFESPCLCRPIAAGSTPHEHSGSGAPSTVARTTVPAPPEPSSDAILCSGSSQRTSPAKKRPRMNHGAISARTAKVFWR